MDVVSHPLDDFEPASRDCRVRGMGVLDGDDAIFRTPDDERRYPRGQVELVARAHRLPTRVNDGAQRGSHGARPKIETPVINKACRVRCNTDVVLMADSAPS